MHSSEIHFLHGNRALFVAPPHDALANDIVRALHIQQPRALIVIAGGAAKMAEDRKRYLTQLFSDGVARAAIQMNAMIIDGGTQSGVMEMVGQGVADHGRTSILLGVAPAGLVTYPGGPELKTDLTEETAPLDPNHSHFVLVESEHWGGETDTLFALAKALSRNIPVVTILANGGHIAQDEVLYTVRNGWPLLIIEGSGRVADEIASLRNKRLAAIEDEEKKEIISQGQISLFPLTGSPSELAKQIVHLLIGSSS
jgi:hypothetical protein